MVATVIATDATVLTLTDCVVEGNTFNQTGVTDYVTPYDGIFVGGARTDVTGKVIVNGVAQRFIGTLIGGNRIQQSDHGTDHILLFDRIIIFQIEKEVKEGMGAAVGITHISGYVLVRPADL